MIEWSTSTSQITFVPPHITMTKIAFHKPSILFSKSNLPKSNQEPVTTFVNLANHMLCFKKNLGAIEGLEPSVYDI